MHGWKAKPFADPHCVADELRARAALFAAAAEQEGN